MATQQPKPVAPRPAPKAGEKTIAPKVLAAQWGMDPKKVRRHLRRLFETTHEDWALTPAMVRALAQEMGVDAKTGQKKA